jgi:CRISPR/Cas system CSM-associated protein Csm2 small subunit
MQMAKLDGAKILSELTQNSFQLAAKGEGEMKEENEGRKEVNSKLLWKRGKKDEEGKNEFSKLFKNIKAICIC